MNYLVIFLNSTKKFDKKLISQKLCMMLSVRYDVAKYSDSEFKTLYGKCFVFFIIRSAQKVAVSDLKSSSPSVGISDTDDTNLSSAETSHMLSNGKQVYYFRI